ncbi:MAG: hypothetical protein AAF183_12910 [Pseudomonadota bacterium]
MSPEPKIRREDCSVPSPTEGYKGPGRYVVSEARENPACARVAIEADFHLWCAVARASAIWARAGHRDVDAEYWRDLREQWLDCLLLYKAGVSRMKGARHGGRL